MTDPLFDALLQESHRRIFEESLPRMRQCLNSLTDTEIWSRPNDNSNSVGNLVLHLCGNARQWIVSGLGGQPDVRQRQEEFDEQGPLPKSQLLTLIEDVETDMKTVLGSLTPAELLRVRKVQTFEEHGVAILIHVIEHFSYHVGQITYIVKALKNVDTGYYSGISLSDS